MSEAGEDTCSESKYKNLPLHLRSCLDYCSLFYKRYSIDKAKVVRLLLAEGLVHQNPGQIADVTAKKSLNELVSLGMLQEIDDGLELRVSTSYLDILVPDMLVTEPATSPVRVVMDDPTGVPPDSERLFVRSLFSYSHDNGFSLPFLKAVCEMKFLVVLDLYGKIERLPDEVGELTHLVYLGLKYCGLDELPVSIGKLQKLETLEITVCRKLRELPVEVLGCQELRHLIMSHCRNDGEVKVPNGIGTMVKLHTCSGLYAGGGIAAELGSITQLRELGVKRVSEDHAAELFASIAKMVDLVSLSLDAFVERRRIGMFPSMESLVPPPLVHDLYLRGRLVELPNWVASMENLSRLVLGSSNLYENPGLVLQFLPNLKYLSLCNAYKGKHIGREFCEAGGFAKLECLTIVSDFLVEWSEIEKGAFPRLKCLSLRNCRNLMFLPQGLQFVSTLEKLCLVPLYSYDLARRLKGEENYKIKHIPELRTYQFHLPSVVSGLP